MMVTTVLLMLTWNSSPITLAIKGVARILNVVAVPAKRAKTASRIDQSAKKSVGVFAEDRAAGFGIFLAVTLAYMEHEAECNSKYEIESPWNQAPVEDRIGTCPVLDASQFCDMRVRCIQDPFRKENRIKCQQQVRL